MTLLIAFILWSVTIGVLGIMIAIQRSRVPHAQGSRREQDELLPEFGDHDRLQASLATLKTHPGDIELGPRLGHGTFGQVYKGKQRSVDGRITSPQQSPVMVAMSKGCLEILLGRMR